MDRLTVYLVRHLRTIDNLKQRYSDASDPPLIEAPEITPLRHRIEASKVICSPLKRARQTAERWFPGITPKIEAGLTEIDFGLFAGKTADDLKDDLHYRAWVNSGCLADIPEGETFHHFNRRVSDAFLRHLADHTVFVTHAGPIMSILEAFADTPRFTTSVDNGQIVEIQWSTTLQHIVAFEVLR
ncbi:MAG TPA: histidine phosphatase family protein [Fastidiosipila sp.]|nr:histidine phosphatase family protein [Fastidiosipila sp.]